MTDRPLTAETRTPAERLRRELYLRVQEDPRIFEFLQASCMDGLWYWDLEHPEDEWLSPRLKEVFGYEDHEIPNTSDWWHDNIHPDDLSVVIESFRRHCEDPSQPYDQVVRFHDKRGDVVWVRCRGMAIRDEEGRPIRMLGAHTDVTGLKQGEEIERLNSELQDKVVALEAANRDLDEFAYVASHDLRAPLRAIENLTSWLQEDLEEHMTAQQRADMETVCDRVKKLDAMIVDLLTYYRSGRAGEEPTPVDVRELLEEVVELLQPRAGFEIRLPDELPVLVAPRAALTHVFTNLLSNALEYHDGEQGTVTIEFRESTRFARFRITDDGPGIPAEFQHKAFGLFQSWNHEQGQESTGMGLAIVKRTVEAHGGSIRLEPRGGRGASFRILWPKHEAGQ